MDITDIISKKDKKKEKNDAFIEFIHVPKTGGSAIESTFAEYQWGANLPFRTMEQRLGCPYLHPCVFWHNPSIFQKIYQGKLCFGVLRNPIDRLISAYKWQNLPDNVQVMNDTIEKWLRDDYPKNTFCYHNHLCPQHVFLRHCHVTLRYEYLQHDLDIFCRFVGIPPRRLQHVNVSSSSYVVIHSESIYPSTLEWIDKVYKIDFQLYYYIHFHLNTKWNVKNPKKF